MSGLGRRTHYRKHLTDSVLHDFPEPHADECIAQVTASRGGNQFDVCFFDKNKSVLAILPTKFRKLVWVKRNDYVIVRVADATAGAVDNDGNDDDADAVRDLQADADVALTGNASSMKNTSSHDDDEDDHHDAEVSTYAKDKESSAALSTASTTAANTTTSGIQCIITHILYKEQIKHLQQTGHWPEQFAFENAEDDADEADDNGIVYGDDPNDDDLLFVNTNRIANLAVQDSSSSSDDDDDADDL
jgi:probable RNA-binding protein EIF1AD